MAVRVRIGRASRTSLPIGVVIVSTFALASCNSASGALPADKEVSPVTSASTGSSSPAGPPAAAARRAATAAYLAMWQDMASAAQTSDWKSPILARHATGDALSTISRGLYADHLNGLVSKGAPKDDPKVTSAVPAAAPTTVTVSDCGDSTAWLKYRKGSSNPVGDKGGRRAITAEVHKQVDGSWKVSRFAVEGLGSC